MPYIHRSGQFGIWQPWPHDSRRIMTFHDTPERLSRRLTPHPSSRPTGGACPESVEGSGGIPARSEIQTPESGDEIPPLRGLVAVPVGMTGGARRGFRRIMTIPDTSWRHVLDRMQQQLDRTLYSCRSAKLYRSVRFRQHYGREAHSKNRVMTNHDIQNPLRVTPDGAKRKSGVQSHRRRFSRRHWTPALPAVGRGDNPGCGDDSLQFMTFPDTPLFGTETRP